MDYSTFTNDDPQAQPLPPQFSTTTCTPGASSTVCITEYPAIFHTQDAGNVSWGLAVIIAILSFALILYVYNLFSTKKPLV